MLFGAALKSDASPPTRLALITPFRLTPVTVTVLVVAGAVPTCVDHPAILVGLAVIVGLSTEPLTVTVEALPSAIPPP